MRSLRFVFIVIAAAVISPPASAEPDRPKPVRFMCEGEMIARSGDATHRSNLSVAFDVSTGTVEVSGWGEASITSKLDADTLTFEARPRTVGGQSKGAINRITGRAAIVVRRSGFEGLFHGRCRTGQRFRIEPLSQLHLAPI